MSTQNEASLTAKIAQFKEKSDLEELKVQTL